MEPETRYARSGDVSIAYQVVGEGPIDIVYVPGFISHVELGWAVAARADLVRRLNSIGRVILFDKRGTGMSDRIEGAPALEVRMDDVRAVMDAAQSERAALLGISEGGPMSILFAATYPDRTSALILWGGMARKTWAPDYPIGASPEEQQRDLEIDLAIFGTQEETERVAQTYGVTDPTTARQLIDYFRRSATPGAVRALIEMNNEIDVRHVLPVIRVPTLIAHADGDEVVPPAWGRYVADRIPGARFVAFPGGHVLSGSVLTDFAGEVERFLAEIQEAGQWEEHGAERVLATVLFTDIVGSTARAAELGDARWRELLEAHHALIRRQLVRFRGKELDTAGDGFFASFDGPARAIRCACAITEAVRELDLEVRAGLHTGECEVLDGKVGGIAVHIGARVASEAEPGEVLVSGTVRDLVAGSGLEFRERGVAELKGVPGEWRLYAVEP